MNGVTAGIDIGGTKIRWVLMRHRRVVASKEIKTPREKIALERSVRALAEVLVRRGAGGIGISMAGAVSGNVFKGGRNLPLAHDIDFGKIMPRHVTFKLDNDARCFARSEAAFGHGKRSSPVLAMTIGTGIGRAMIVGGKVVKLKRFEYAEPWESAYQKHRLDPAPRLAGFLAQNIAPIAADLNVRLVVIGGGRMRTKGLFTALRKELKKRGVRYPIRRSHFRQNTAAIGAALLVGGRDGL